MDIFKAQQERLYKLKGSTYEIDAAANQIKEYLSICKGIEDIRVNVRYKGIGTFKEAHGLRDFEIILRVGKFMSVVEARDLTKSQLIHVVNIHIKDLKLMEDE